MADYADLLAAEKTKKDQDQTDAEKARVEKKTVSHSPTAKQQKPKEGTKKPQNEKINLSVNQVINRSINQLTNHLDDRIMNKPKGFYISDRLDRRFDKAVEYFGEKHQLKIDRSILLNALLEDDGMWDEGSLDGLIDRLINQLTRKLTNR